MTCLQDDLERQTMKKSKELLSDTEEIRYLSLGMSEMNLKAPKPINQQNLELLMLPGKETWEIYGLEVRGCRIKVSTIKRSE